MTNPAAEAAREWLTMRCIGAMDADLRDADTQSLAALLTKAREDERAANESVCFELAKDHERRAINVGIGNPRKSWQHKKAMAQHNAAMSCKEAIHARGDVP